MLKRAYHSDKHKQRRPVVIRLDGPALKSLRLARGWTQSELADLIGKSKPYIGLMENELFVPSWNAIERLQEVFGAELQDTGALTVEFQ